MNDKEKVTDVDVEAGQPIHINLEGIKLEGVSKEDATRIAEAAAKQAFTAVEATYKEAITQLEADKASLEQRAEAAEQERDALQAEKNEHERKLAFDALFGEYAIAQEARAELYDTTFVGMSVEQARPVLKHMSKFMKPATEAPVDRDVPVITEDTEELDDPVAIGKAIAEQLMPTKAQN